MPEAPFFGPLPEKDLNLDNILRYCQQNINTFYRHLSVPSLDIVAGLTIGGTLDVTGAVTLDGTLTVEGTTDINAGLTVDDLVIEAQDGSDEGGEITLSGAGSNPDWIIDVFQDDLRYRNESGASATHLWRLNGAQVMQLATTAGHNLQGLAWTTWAPTTTNLTEGSGTTVARYCRMGNTVFLEYRFTFAADSAVAGSITMSLPFTAAAADRRQVGHCFLGDTGTAGHVGLIEMATTTSIELLRQAVSGANIIRSALSSTTPFTWTTNDVIAFSFNYEAA